MHHCMYTTLISLTLSNGMSSCLERNFEFENGKEPSYMESPKVFHRLNPVLDVIFDKITFVIANIYGPNNDDTNFI